MSIAHIDRSVPVSCDRDCGAGCPLHAHVSGGRLVRITDNPQAPELMRGCIKGYRMADTVYAADRLRSPLMRTGGRGEGRFREVGWPEALDYIAARLDEIRARHGCLSFLPFHGSGSCRAAVHNTSLVGRRFFALLGGFVNRTDSYSSAASAFTDMHLFGTRLTGTDPLTLERSRMILLWGANICETRFSSRIEAVIARVKRDGVPVIVVDPRRTETVRKLATQWVPILPGTDSAMLAAMLHVIVAEGFLDRQFVDRCTVGFDDLIDYITGRSDGQPKTPAWAAGICGVPEETIIGLARSYARARPAALLPGLSIQRTLGGEETYRFTVALQAATGNIGVEGGSSGGEFWGKLPKIAFPTLPVPDVPGLPTVPVYRWPDAVLEGRSGGYPSDIHLIYSIGANYLNQGSDIKKNIRAFNTGGPGGHPRPVHDTDCPVQRRRAAGDDLARARGRDVPGRPLPLLFAPGDRTPPLAAATTTTSSATWRTGWDSARPIRRAAPPQAMARASAGRFRDRGHRSIQRNRVFSRAPISGASA